MMQLNLPPFNTEELEITPLQKDGTIVVVVAGSATAYRPDDLRSYLQKLHTECIRVGAQEVSVDLRALEFMNSAGFSTFIDWLVTLQEEDTGSQYRVRYLSNSDYAWQRRSLHALQCLAVDLVTIDL